MARPQHWWDTAVIYEIYPRSFQDSNGDGVGDLRGILSRLDYLKGGENALDVDAIWLSPIYPSPMHDFGYDISDYRAIDPVFGTLEDFDDLARGCHERGIKVIMDLVANHTSHLHAWFQASRASRDNPYRDWYVWRDPAPGGGPPNNWISQFGGPAWTFDETTDQYYLHSFLAEQPDLNWRNPAVRQAIFDMVRWWIDRGVDGFRLDAIGHIAKDEALRDNPPLPETPSVTGERAKVVKYDQRHPIIHEWLQELRVVVEEDGEPRLLVSEIYDLEPEEVRLFHGAEKPEMNMSFNFWLIGSPWDAQVFRAGVDEFERHLPPGVLPNMVLNNHDQPRFVSRYDEDGLGEERARLAAMLLLSLPGAAYVYYGEEIGMRDGDIPQDRLQDPVGVRGWPEKPGRDAERTPMQWSGEPKAGFTSGEPWLPINPEHTRINVAAEAGDTGSLLNLYRSLIALRRQEPFRSGAYHAVDGGPDVYAYLRDNGNQRAIVALNFADEPRTLRGEWGPQGSIALSTRLGRHGSLDFPLELGPLEGVIVCLP